ncbi:MAG: hypothetical protein A2X34_03250 [Elusimicrobia bacterium GWC2_51_8]|nr:MAG: hypothetical protein A2X33_07030 [Elusimicrobia bacterium GWA2_51_34]OGR58324.1 MAG: hypothetical protein A2X34_03250 [Elusimicrobia bacterium GWC2_51_8]OGR87209.1 MAG: hypothetical protein A2021_08240 [Elusimicrobia bacterium GWF2_52_66]HAF95928.1 hypothetical protein [Elusimicrobiota bacterium]HCE97385.1 hypothetical protein [Elusimicrobiota bacterium]
MKFWKIYCMESEWPGLWRRFFQNQAVAVGFPPKRRNGYKKAWKLNDAAGDAKWTHAQNCFKEIKPGDKIVVQLKDHCIGRIGEVVGLAIEDKDWNPLVRCSKRLPTGEMGRRINVRWKLVDVPLDPDIIIRLPEDAQFTSGLSRASICSIPKTAFLKIKDAASKKDNWEDLLPHKFSKEKAISDYLGTYPHRLDETFHPYPDAKIREKVFKDHTRADVLLEDNHGNPVVVECKQNTPQREDIYQLRHYMRLISRETGEKRVKGILVHGGNNWLPKQVQKCSRLKPPVEIVRYKYLVDFFKS